jgi:hypothetical protein
MTSLRRIQLLNANIARISIVINRIRESLNVANASTPKTRYAINDMAKRLIFNSQICHSEIPRKMRSGFRQRAPASLTPAKRLKFWCTGKDSNLRTSLGGTDLQSVGFNHSPTCADTAGRCSRCPSSPSSKPSSRTSSRTRKLRQHTSAPSRSSTFTRLSQIRISQSRETKNRATNLLREDHCTPESFRIYFRMKCVGKTCCATWLRKLRIPQPAGSRSEFMPCVSYAGAGEGI